MIEGIVGLIITALIGIIVWLIKARLGHESDHLKDMSQNIVESNHSVSKELLRLTESMNVVRSDLAGNILMQSERNAVVASNIEVLFKKIEEQYSMVSTLQQQMARVITIIERTQ